MKAKIWTIVSGASSGALNIAMVVADALREEYQSEVIFRKYNKTAHKHVPFIADRYVLDFVRSLRQRLLTEKPQLLLVHGYSTHLWVKLAARGLSIPIIHVEHNTEKYTWLRRRLLCWLDAETTAYICVSQGVARHLIAQGIDPVKVQVIYNGIDLTQFAVTQEPQANYTVGMTARFSKQKDQMTLIKAVEILVREKNIPLRLVFQGEGKTRLSCEQYVTEKKLEEWIAFTTGNFKDLLPKLDLFVLATHYEGLPLVLCEAMAAKVPVIASDVPGVPEIVHHTKNGLLVERQSPNALAAAIAAQYQEQRESSALYHARIDAAYQNVCQFFTLPLMCRQYCREVEQVLKNKEI